MTPSTSQYLTTKELGELLRIKERKIYAMVSAGEIPCTRATGKLLFSRQDIEAWLAQNGSSPMKVAPSTPRPNVFLGSHDPLLVWALKESGCRIATDFGGSLDGVERFMANEGMAAAVHLYDSESDDWNTPLISSRLSGQAVVMVEFGYRERGLVIRNDMIDHIRSVADLRGHRIVPRQASAGTQILLEFLLKQHDLDRSELNYTSVAHTETDAVTSVLDGSADVTFGLQGIARRFDLAFIPVIRERFDILIDRQAWFEPPFQKFWAFCQSNDFKKHAKSLHGYDIQGLGRIRFNG